MNPDRLPGRVGLTVVVAAALTIAFFGVAKYGHGNGFVLAILIMVGTTMLGGWLASRERSKPAGFAIFAGLALALLGQIIFFLAFVNWLAERTA